MINRQLQEIPEEMEANSVTHNSSFAVLQAFDPIHFAPLGIKETPDTLALRPFSAPRPSQQEHEDRFRFQAIDHAEHSNDTTIKSIRLLDPVEVHDGETPSKVQHILDTFSSYDRRIQVLQEQAKLDAYSLNNASRQAFLHFCLQNPLMRRARLVLMENGNLRATWKNENGTHIGLQFQDSQSIQYVIFTRREPESPISRVSGRDTMDGIMHQIDAFDVRDIVAHET